MPKGRNVLIVGAGPVGLTAALELARRGFLPRIVDSKAGPTPPEESRALAINLRTLHLLGASGVSGDILATAHQVREMRLMSADSRLMTVDLREELAEVPAELDPSCRGIHVLPQGTTERLLIDRLQSLGVVPEWNRTCVKLDERSDGVAAELTSPNGARGIASSEIVIGADGAYSTVREQAGFGFPGKSVDQDFHLADYSYHGEFDNSFVELLFLDPGAIVRIPIDSHRVRFVSTAVDFRDRIEHPATIGQLLWESEFRVSFRHVSRMHSGQIFLAGDAAHIHSPIGGRGMNLGIEDACWLAWLISENRETEYTKLRIPAVRHVLSDTFRNTRFVLMSNPFAIAARNMLLPRIENSNAIRRRGLRGILGLDTPPPPWLDSPETTAAGHL